MSYGVTHAGLHYYPPSSSASGSSEPWFPSCWWHQFASTGATGCWVDPSDPDPVRWADACIGTDPGLPWLPSPPRRRCECGAHLCRDAGHALWCPMYE